MNDSNLLKPHRITAIVVLTLAVLFYLYEFAIRTMPSVMVHELMKEFGITAAGLGVLSSVFYYGYTAMQLPVGMLFDKFSARLLIIIAMLATTLATILFGFAKNIYQADFAYFIIGFAASFGFIGALVIASRWFPAKHYTLLVGLVQFMGSVGAIAGQHPMAILVKNIGWRETTFTAAIAGGILVLLMWFFLKDHAPSSESNQSDEQAGVIHTHKVWQGLKTILKKKQTWWVALYSFSSWTPVIIFAGFWGIPFFMTLYNTSADVAAGAMTAAWLGIAIASPVFGWWTDKMGRRKPLLIICALLGIFSSIFIIYGEGLSWSVLYFLLFVMGAAAGGQSLSFGVVQDINSPKAAGTAIAFNNMAIICGGIIFPPMVGFILKAFWNGQMLQGVPTYSIDSYQIALLIVPLCYAVNLFTALFFVRETYCQPHYKEQN